MNVREVRSNKKEQKRPRPELPTQAEVDGIRTGIAVYKVNLQTGSITLLMGGMEYRLQKVNKGATEPFCIAAADHQLTLAQERALKAEAFERFEDAREAQKRPRSSVSRTA